MVWWATVSGNTFGIPPEVINEQLDNNKLAFMFKSNQNIILALLRIFFYVRDIISKQLLSGYGLDILSSRDVNP